MAQGLALALELGNGLEHDKRCKDSAVAVVEVAEIVMACKLAAEDAVLLADLHLGVGVSDLPCDDLGGTDLLEILGSGAGGADVYKNRAFLPGKVVHAQDAGDVVRLDEAAALIDEHHAVCIAVVDDSAVGAVLLHCFHDLGAVLNIERIGLVSGEGTIHGVVDVFRVVAEKLLHVEIAHAVGGIYTQAEVRKVGQKLLLIVQIGIVDVLFDDLSAL